MSDPGTPVQPRRWLPPLRLDAAELAALRLCYATPPDLLEAARGLVERLRAGAAERDRERAFPHDQLREVREAGLEAVLVPREHGGRGGTWLDAIRVTEILAEGDPNVAQIYLVHQVVAANIVEVAPPELCAELSRRTAEGTLRWASAYSELRTPHGHSFAVRLTPDGDGYRLNGEKFYSTGSMGGDMLFASAVVEGSDRLMLVFVPTAAPGVERADDWSGIGQKTTSSGTTRFHDVHVPGRYAIPMELTSPDSLLGPMAQASFSAIFLGIARDALRDAYIYVYERARPAPYSGVDRAVDDPYTLLRLGEVQTRIDAADAMQARALDHMAAYLAEPTVARRGAASVAIAQAKTLTGNASLEAAETLFKVSGASSTLGKYAHDRHWRNARTLTVHDSEDSKYRIVADYYLKGTLPRVTEVS